MPSLKRKSNNEDFSFPLNSELRKTKKMRLTQNGFTVNVNTHGEGVTLPMYESDEANDSELISQKCHRRKSAKDKKRNAEKSRALYDSIGSMWNVFEKVNVTTSSTDEDNLGFKKLSKKKKSETNRGRVDGEVEATNLISVQSFELNGVKEIISSNFKRNDNIENKTQPKVKKKHRLKNKFNQSEMCSTIEDDTPLVFEGERLKKNKVQNIENTVESEHNGGITNELQVEEERKREVELEKEELTKQVEKNKENKSLPITENEDVSGEYEKNDVINEASIVKEQNVRMVNEELDVREAERKNGNVTEKKRRKKKKKKLKRHSIENSDKCEKNDVIQEVNFIKEQNVRMVNEGLDVMGAERVNDNVTEPNWSEKKNRKSKRNSIQNSDEGEKNNMINEISIIKEQNVSMVNKEFDVRETEGENGNVTEQKKNEKKKRKSKRLSTENSDECKKNDVINEVNIVEEQKARMVNEGLDVREAERENDNVTKQKRSKKKKRKLKRHSIENSDKCEENDGIKEVNFVKEQNVRMVNEELDVMEAERVNDNVTQQNWSEKKKRKSKQNSTQNSDEGEKNNMINEISIIKEQNVSMVNKEFDVKETERENGNVTEQKKNEKKKRKSKRLSTENSDECKKNDVINEVNIVEDQKARMVNEELDVREAERENDNVTEQKRSKKRKRKSKRHSAENSHEAGNVMMEHTGHMDKENEGMSAEQGEIRKKKLGSVNDASERKITKLSDEGESELKNEIDWEQVSKENFVRSQKRLLEEQVENGVHIVEVDKILKDDERVVENSDGKVEWKRKKKLERLKSRAKQKTNTEKTSYDPFKGDDADIDGNNSEQSNENETIGRIKKRVIKLSIESEEEEFEEVNEETSGETVINSDMNWCIEDDSEEDEEDKTFIVDDDYISYDENATSDEEYEDTESSSNDHSSSDDSYSSEEGEEEEEEEEEEKQQCLSVRQKRKERMALQFFDMEAEEGEETDIEDEEEETSSEDDSDGKDDVEGVEQFIDFEAKEEITFVRRKKKVQVIDSEEEEGEKQEKYSQAESLQKTMHIMKKLTRIMTVGVLKGKTIRKQKRIISKEVEDKMHDSDVRIRMNESNDLTIRAVKETKRYDGKSANQKIEELRIQQKVGEEIREILGEDKLGKKKQRKCATIWGRGYASDTEYVESKKPRIEKNNFFPS